jgi:hypothetical protein
MRFLVVPVASAVLVVACGGGSAENDGARAPGKDANVTSIEIAELEISGGKGIDRFTSCPPPGELGQDWIPRLPPWSPAKQEAPKQPDTSGEPVGLPPPTPDGRTPTEKAIFDTYPDFRRCYQRGLLHDPTQDGHAAIVLRIGPDGKVGVVESYGVCALSSEVISCMKAYAGKLRFVPPASGAQTITIPAVFTTRGGRPHEHPSPNDAYTAAAYTRLEEARPDLHLCEQSARSSGQELQAVASFLIDLDAEGRVAHTHVDNWSGNQELLACAAHALEKLSFDKPPAGRGSILARISFNPRAGTK